METKVTQSKIMQAMDWAYEKAVDGVPGLDSASELADSYTKDDKSLTDQINSLIRWQNTKSGTSGFVTGLGGVITMPVAIPANITSVLYIQVRMIAAIAYMCGHDLKDDKVKSLVYMCLAGNAAKDIAKEAGIVFGKKLTTSAIKSISGKTITAINQKVGFRLLTKFGQKGVVNLGKAVPLIGGIIGGTFDTVATNTIGNVARDTFNSDLPAEETVAFG
nr:EcsC family protein [uncultured Halomonas sp.]